MSHDFHFVASSWPGIQPLAQRDRCADLWRRLRARFPKVLAAALMPSHVHLTYSTRDLARTRMELAIELRAFSRRHFPGKGVWMLVPPPDELPNNLHVQRTIRYVHLNPCREGLARDPLEWEWSTHRDALGAAHPSWIDHARLSTLFRLSGERLAREFHRYVSSDPSVSVTGTPMPSPGFSSRDLEGVFAGALAASRAPRTALGLKSDARLTALQLCEELLPAQRPQMQRLLGIHGRTWDRNLASPVPRELLAAARVVLSDARLLKPALASAREFAAIRGISER